MSAINIVKKFFPKVTKVTDARKNATIEVTQRDADSKAVKDHNGCAMAVACKRQFKLDGVIVSRSVAYLVKGNEATRFKLPESVSREVVSFDRGAGFSPGQYELESVPKTSRLGARSDRPTQDEAFRDGKPKRHRHLTTHVRTVLGGKKPEGD